MPKEIKIFRVTGVIDSGLSLKYDVNMTVKAYSLKQARLKVFFMLRQNSMFKAIPNTILIGWIRKLSMHEKKD